MRDKCDRGLVMPAVLFIYVFCVIFILLLAQRALQHSKAAIAITKGMGGTTMAQGGIQLGLARLARRISYIPAVISSGAFANNGQTFCNGEVLAAGATFWISEPDLQCYDTVSPGNFWTENVSSSTLSSYGYTLKSDETDFSTAAVVNFGTLSNAQFSVANASHTVTVTLFYAGSQMGSAGYNDIWLRYGYQIDSTDNNTGKTLHVRSYISDPNDTIQIHVKRPLSRYNLFAAYNTLPPAQGSNPVYDGTSYTGPVYSKFTYYQQGDPRFSSTVDISSVASPSCVHKTNGSCAWKRPNGSTFTVGQPHPPLELPGSLEEASQAGFAYWGADGAAVPGGLTANDIYPATHTISRSFGGVDIATVSIYVNGDASICIENLPAGTTTLYHIKTNPPYDPPCSGPFNGVNDITTNPNNVTLPQDVWEWADPNLVIFVNGNLGVEGAVSNRSKVTLAAGGSNLGVGNDLVVKGSVTYANGSLPNSSTVIGLISWEGNALISKNMCATLCNPLLQAVIMAPQGGFGSEGFTNFPANYAGFNGTVQHAGAFIRAYALPTLSSDLTKGWGINTQYDTDLQFNKAPPHFPGNGQYQMPQTDTQYIRVVDLFRFL